MFTKRNIARLAAFVCLLASVAGAQTYTLSPASISFGNVVLGQSATAQFTVKNTDAVNTLNVTSVTMSSTDFHAFTSSDYPSANSDVALSLSSGTHAISPNGQQVINLTFHALALGAKSGKIMLSSDGTAVGADSITYTATVVSASTTSATTTAPAAVPEKPGIGLFTDPWGAARGDTTWVAFHLKWQAFSLNLDSVRWDFGDGTTGVGKDILYPYVGYGPFTPKVAAKSTDNTVYSYTGEALDFTPKVASVEPTVPTDAGQVMPKNIGSKMVKSKTKAGGARRSGKPVAMENVTWGQAKNSGQ